MNKTDVSFRYRKSIVTLKGTNTKNRVEEYFLKEFCVNLVSLGFIFTEDAYKSLEKASVKSVKNIYYELTAAIKKYLGANVKHKPMYPNFPQQVAEMSEIDLYFNAIIHYWSAGTWLPEYNKLARRKADDEVILKEIGLVSREEFFDIFKSLVSSNDSISEEDKEVIKWFVEKFEEAELPDEIPHKEILCYVASLMYGSTEFREILKRTNTSTDILRIVTALSGGDISLAENTKFKSLPRAIRRMLISRLEEVINKEDINRHRNKWIRLFHGLHIGESNASECKKIASIIRSNGTIRTFNSNVEDAITNTSIDKAIELLNGRPSEYARRLDHLLRVSEDKDYVLNGFKKVADSVPTRILAQLFGHFKDRNHSDFRVVLPKGSVAKAIILDKDENYNIVPESICEKTKEMISDTLGKRFSGLEDLGSVYIDESLEECPIPTQQRSASGGFRVARGTRIPFSKEKDTLRFFVHWVGRDIDLSASLWDSNFKFMENVSYTNLRSSRYQAYHSGDIINAPKGASEFIDIDIPSALKHGARYVMQHVYSYSGENFSEIKDCFIGCMTRKNPNSNEIYDPKNVEHKIDLNGDGKSSIAVIYDLLERKSIWVDLLAGSQTFRGGNNFESNKNDSQKMLEALVSTNNKMSLYELFQTHAEVRGTLVDDPEEAETIFSLNEGVTPFEIDKISSEFLV